VSPRAALLVLGLVLAAGCGSRPAPRTAPDAAAPPAPADLLTDRIREAKPREGLSGDNSPRSPTSRPASATSG